MANVTITQLPAAGPITGTESVPIVQNGQTVQTTTAAIAASPSQTQTFLTVNQEITLPNSRYFSVGTGLGIVDNGAQSYLRIVLNAASGSLESASNGIIAKDSVSTVVARTITSGSSGLSITNGNGVSGNPTISLTGTVVSLANLSSIGMLSVGGGSVNARTLLGTANQIDIVNGDGTNNPTFSIASNPIIPGTGAMIIPTGTTAQRPGGTDGMIRYNTDTNAFEVYENSSWSNLPAGAVTLINTGTGLTGGPITTSGTISIANTGVSAATYGSSSTVPQIAVNAQGQITSASNVTITPASIGAVATVSGTANEITSTGTTNVTLSLPSALTFTGKTVTGGTFNMSAATVSADNVVTENAVQTLTNKSISGSSNTLSNIGNSSLTNSSVTYNGVNVSLGGSGTITAVNPYVLTIGTGLNGTSYDGSSPVTIEIDSTVATLTGVQSLTNKTISGTSNTLSNIGNASLTNSSLTVNGVAISLGGSGTVTASTTSTLTIGTGLSGTSFNGGAPVTIAIDSTVATLTGIQTLTNKTIDAANNTLSNIGNSSLTNSSITIGSTSVSLGGTSTTLAGLTSVTLTQDPSSALQAATKQYVDALVSGINFHEAVQYASTAALPAYTYNNGVSGVGATITANANGPLVLDGHTFVAPADTGLRVLIKNEPSAGGLDAYNGVYTVTQVGVAGGGGSPFILTRATDCDTAGTGPNKINAGDLFLVLGGSTQANTSWVQQTPLPITVGTTALTFVQFAAPLVYTAGTGLTESPAYQFNIANTGVSAATYGSASQTVTLAINAQGQITSASQASISINGNQITSGTVGSSYISGSYTGITGVGTLTAGTWNASTIQALYGGTGQTSYAVGDLLYASGATALSKLALGTTNYVLTAGPAAPQYVAQSTLSVGAAANTAITDDTTTNATMYPTWVTANTGDLPQKVTSTKLFFNPSTGVLTSTGGISGGTF